MDWRGVGGGGGECRLEGVGVCEAASVDWRKWVWGGGWECGLEGVGVCGAESLDWGESVRGGLREWIALQGGLVPEAHA